MRMVKIRRRILVVILLVIIAVGAGVWLWQLHKNKKSGTELVLYGNVDIRQVQLAFNGNERIATILVKEGDKVKRGGCLQPWRPNA